MKFSDLKLKDKVGAFANYVTMSDAKKQGLIKEQLHSSFDDHCGCGSEVIITTNLKTFTCCDPRCPYKISGALHYMFVDFSCKNVGERTCESYALYAYPTLEVKSHLHLLMEAHKYNPIDVTGSAIANFSMGVYKIRTQELSFPEMVSRIGIPTISKGSATLFEGLSSSKELLTEIQERGSVKNFLASRGSDDLRKCFYLEEFLPDIIYAEFKVFANKVPVGKIDLPICITGSLFCQGMKTTKAEFLTLCNKEGELSPDFRLFNVRKTEAISTTEYLIADFPSNSDKYVEGKRRESVRLENYMRANNLSPEEVPEELPFEVKLVFTSDEFLERLKYFKKICVEGMAKKAREE